MVNNLMAPMTFCPRPGLRPAEMDGLHDFRERAEPAAAVIVPQRWYGRDYPALLACLLADHVSPAVADARPGTLRSFLGQRLTSAAG